MPTIAMGGSMYAEVRTPGFFRPKVVTRLDSISNSNSNYSTTSSWCTRSRSRSISSSRSSSPDSSPFGGRRQLNASRINKRRKNSIEMADGGQLPSIRALFPFFDKANHTPEQMQTPQSVQLQQSQPPPVLPLTSNSPATASEYTLADSRRSTATAAVLNDDGSTAYTRSRGHAYRLSNSQIPRNAVDLPMPASGASVSSSRRSSSGYGSTDRGRSFDSPGRDQQDVRDHRDYRDPRDQVAAAGPSSQQYGFPPRHSFAGPSSIAPTTTDPQPLSYRMTSRLNEGQSQYDQSAPLYQHQHPSRMQSRSSDLTARSYHPQPPQPPQHPQQHQYSQQHQHSQHSQHHHHHHHQPTQSHGFPQISGEYQHDYYTAQIRNRDQLGRDGHHSHSIMGIHSTSMAMNNMRSRRDSYLNKKKRGNLPKEKTDILTEWLKNNLDHPYPSDEQKQEFIRQTDLDMNQISNWFINARRRKCPELVKIRERSLRQMAGDPGDME